MKRNQIWVVVFRKSESCVQIAREILISGFLPKIFWMQLGISNQEAKDMLESESISVVENKCIKIEHQRLVGGKI
ncbi:CoA-binding protein [Helicobacter sp. 12S02232-10]|uniref:CoA-binding protein n=1 Tax=Helicobacter sp. 12S02232-10 TaxID=1476197 RepID=UPI0021515740|nr:CoA-binding protein [Helicobacter sp. 12S02232-10]